MSKDQIINIFPKEKKKKDIKPENFINTSNKKNLYLLPKQDINKKIFDRLSKCFQNSKNLEKIKKDTILIVLNSYSKILKGEILNNEDFIISKQEITEFFKLEDKDIVRYIYYRYKYNKFPSLHKLDDYPPNIQIEPTSICNLRCIMCYQSDRTFSKKSGGHMGYMSLDILKKVVDEIEGKIEAVTFASRGEPTLHKELDKFLKYCEGKFLALKLNTNATLLNEQKINMLLSSDLETLVLSIDEKNKETYEKIRVNAKFDKIMKNLELLKNIREKNYSNSKIRVRISGVKINTDQNVEEMNKFYNEFADEITLVNYDPWQSSYENPINEIEEPCTELYRRMFVWWDGKVNPCDHDYKSLLSKWNIKDHSIKSIWNSDNYNKLRKIHQQKKRSQLEPCNRCLST
ncbi:radical SAM/SPASM domain-containing protein [Candidatus Pelagibacter communis]|uniref:radical SAM/SPASM domain-containing protein n=1 Tax=Pelagibacter ubique TaxID=198252 RepID=UPI00094C097E|nr:radical SAM protein [Candidatus Pelagibacter ubique]